jgi:hypothetical protein
MISISRAMSLDGFIVRFYSGELQTANGVWATATLVHKRDSGLLRISGMREPARHFYKTDWQRIGSIITIS